MSKSVVVLAKSGIDIQSIVKAQVTENMPGTIFCYIDFSRSQNEPSVEACISTSLHIRAHSIVVLADNVDSVGNTTWYNKLAYEFGKRYSETLKKDVIFVLRFHDQSNMYKFKSALKTAGITEYFYFD